MTRNTNASSAELARRIEQHLPVFARPTLEQLIAAGRPPPHPPHAGRLSRTTTAEQHAEPAIAPAFCFGEF